MTIYFVQFDASPVQIAAQLKISINEVETVIKSLHKKDI